MSHKCTEAFSTLQADGTLFAPRFRGIAALIAPTEDVVAQLHLGIEVALAFRAIGLSEQLVVNARDVFLEVLESAEVPIVNPADQRVLESLVVLAGNMAQKLELRGKD
jgi:hypothetical protein